MPTPLSLTSEEMDLLERLAAPVAWGQREQFLQKVADALAACPATGPGAVYRAARDVQRHFTLEAQRQADATALPRHPGPRPALRV